MTPQRAAVRVLVAAVGFVVVDQATKQLAGLVLRVSPTVFIVDPFLGMRVTQTHPTVASRVAFAIFALVSAAGICILTIIRKLRRPSDFLFAGCWIGYAVSTLFEDLGHGGVMKFLIVRANSSTSRALDLGDLLLAAAALFWFVTYVFQPTVTGRPR